MVVSAGNPVNVGPLQRIVGVSWPNQQLIVEIILNWWGTRQGIIPCSPNTSPAGIPDYATVYSPGFFCTGFRLRPQKSSYLAGYTDGIYSIGGLPPGESGYTYSGMPSLSEFSASMWQIICLNDDAFYLESEYGTDFRMNRIYTSSDGLSVDFALRSPSTSGTKWCQSGNTWQDLDSRGVSNTDDTYSFEAFRETLNFSGFTLTRSSDSMVFHAESVGIVPSEDNNHIAIVMTQASA